jgi:mannan endo-1,4-beta-mannosidase
MSLNSFSLRHFFLAPFCVLMFLAAFSLPAWAQNLGWTQTTFTPADVTALNSRSVFFVHNSVGDNIVSGLRAVAPGLTITNAVTSGGQPSATGFSELYMNTYAANTGNPIPSFNGRPLDKITYFETLMDNGGRNAQIAFFKFCYVDFDNNLPEPEVLIPAYESMLNTLQARYPNVTFVHMTAPLYVYNQSWHNRKQHALNNWLRSTYPGRVFDLAAIQAVNANGTAAPTALSPSVGAPTLSTDWAANANDSHLNSAGGQRVASGLISFLAQVRNTPSSTHDLRITGGAEGTNWSYPANTLTILQNGTYTITMATAGATTLTDRIVVQPGLTDVNITLNGVSINRSGGTGDTDENCAFLMEGATVNLTLVGTNLLQSGENRAGLQVPSGSAKLTIGGTGVLRATAGGGAGIGGSNSDTGGMITINSGEVTATGSAGGAGIGDGGGVGIGSLSEAAANKQRLMNYLRDQYGKNIIAGQMDVDWGVGEDMVGEVYRDTDKYPAIKGFDFMQAHPDYDYNAYWRGRQQIKEAIHWWNGRNGNEDGVRDNYTAMIPERSDLHGIVTFIWHWRMAAAVGGTPAFYTSRGDSDNYTEFRIPWRNNQLDTESSDFAIIRADLEYVATLLQQLKDLNIPVLWRPLHEASGQQSGTNAWFWWGASGPEPYRALWKYMYDFLTVEKGFDNLIWVWNGEHEAFYPDPATVDIVSFDYYAPSTGQTNLSFKTQFDNTLNMVPASERGSMMIALTENGTMPNPDRCIADNAMWSWFMTWVNHFWREDRYNTLDHRRRVYNHLNVITLEDLPDLTQYRLN